MRESLIDRYREQGKADEENPKHKALEVLIL